MQPARPVRLRRHQREHPARPARSTASTRKVLRAPRAQRLHLRARPRDRRGAVGRRRSCTSPRRTGVDLKTGRLHYERRRRSRSTGKVVRDICPAAPGAKDWQPSAFSPRTGLLYIPHQNLCMDAESVEVELHRRHALRRRRTCKMYAGPGRPPRRVHRLGPGRAARRSGAIKENFPVWSGALVTAGDVVFYGTMDGWFKAVDARPATLLWQFKTGSGIIGQPITYRGPDGKQYVAILSGVGGWAGADRRRRPRPARRHRGARLRQRDEGPADRHDQGRHALCLRASLRPRMIAASSRPRCSRCRPMPALGAPSATPAQRRVLRVCADPEQPAVLERRRRRVREPDRRAARPRSAARRSSTPGGRSAAASSATRCRPAMCDVVMGVPAGFELALDDRARTTARRYVFVSRARPRARLRSLRRPAAARARDRRAADRRRRREHAAGACAGAARHRRQRASAIRSTATTASRARRRASSTRSRDGEIDVAVVWGPLAGYFAPRQTVPLRDRAGAGRRSTLPACRSPSTSRWACARTTRRCATQLDAVLDRAARRDRRDPRRVRRAARRPSRRRGEAVDERARRACCVALVLTRRLRARGARLPTDAAAGSADRRRSH